MVSEILILLLSIGSVASLLVGARLGWLLACVGFGIVGFRAESPVLWLAALIPAVWCFWMHYHMESQAAAEEGVVPGP